MKRTFALLCLTLLLALPLAAGTLAAALHGDVIAHKSCRYCGMDREKFAHSRMLIEYGDGSATPTCSLHCAAVDLANNIDKSPRSIKVADLETTELIDAEKAVWVIGGTRQGVMTVNAKWAFGSRETASAFIGKHGGRQAGFEEAIKAAYEDMYNDTRMIRERRSQKKMQQGGPAHKGH